MLLSIATFSIYIILWLLHKLSNICKPEEGWYGQRKYCYKKQYTLFLQKSLDFSFLVYDIIIHFIRFEGDFVTAIIVFNFILFYFARRLAWWHLYCKTIVFLITAKKLDNFTFNTFTFSYPIFHARVNHFPNIWAIHAKIGAPKYKISPSPSNKPLNAAGSLRPGSVQWKLVPNHKHGKLILKTKDVYIEIYLSIYSSFYSFVYFLTAVL